MIDEYFTDLENRIASGEGMSGRVFDTVRLDGNGALIRENYVILFSPVALDIPQSRFTKVQTFEDDVEFEADLRVVGTTPATVRRMLSVVMRQLVGHLASAPGRQPAKVTLGSQDKVREDQSVKPFLYFANASVEWTSRAA